MMKKTLAVGGAAVLAWSLAACGGAVSSSDAEASVDQAVAAIGLAETEVSGTAFALDEEGSKGWEVEVAVDDSVTEVMVNQEGTEVTKTRSDGRMDLDDRNRLAGATVPMAEAIQTAAKEVVGRVESAELGRFRATTLVWEVSFDDGEDDVEVKINATSGAVEDVDRD